LQSIAPSAGYTLWQVGDELLLQAPYGQPLPLQLMTAPVGVTPAVPAEPLDPATLGPPPGIPPEAPPVPALPALPLALPAAPPFELGEAGSVLPHATSPSPKTSSVIADEFIIGAIQVRSVMQVTSS